MFIPLFSVKLTPVTRTGRRGRRLFCAQCGTRAESAWAFCQSCGRQLPASKSDVDEDTRPRTAVSKPVEVPPFSRAWAESEPPTNWTTANDADDESTSSSPSQFGTSPHSVPASAMPPATAISSQTLAQATGLLPHATAWGQSPASIHVGDTASFGARFGARVIDGVLLGIVTYAAVFGGIEWGLHSEHNPSLAALLWWWLIGVYLVPLLLVIVYRILGEGSPHGQTPGKAMVGIRVVQFGELEPAGYGRAFGRYIVAGLGDVLLFLGSLSMLWNPQHRTWADRASGTAVVRKEPGEPAGVSTAVVATLVIALASACALAGLIHVDATKSSAVYGNSQYASGNTVTNPGYDSGGSDGQQSGEGTTLPAPDSPGPALADPQTQVNSVEQLLETSAASRPQLAAAINSVMSCADVSGGAQTIETVLQNRQQELTQARQLDLGTVPNGSQIQQALIGALNASVASDTNYENWAQWVSTQPCNGHAPSNSDLQDASSTDLAASQAKDAFVSVWNPIAAQYALPTRQNSDL